MEDALKTLGSLIDAIVRDARGYIDSERESVLSAKILTNTAAAAEITHLREQNALLTRLLQSENLRADKAKDELIQRVSGLLGEFTSARDQSLRAAVAQVRDQNLKAEEDMAKFGIAHGEIMDSIITMGAESEVAFDRRGKEGKRTRDGSLKVGGSFLSRGSLLIVKVAFNLHEVSAEGWSIKLAEFHLDFDVDLLD